MSADADSTADDAGAPLPVSDRIAALDALRGVALLGIFIMNMPGFSHSLFAVAAPPQSALDALVALLRDLLFAGKFNLLFGLVFGVGFALQMARLESSPRTPDARGAARRAAAIQTRRLAFLLVVGLVHAMLLWPGDVLAVYAVLGVALLALRRLGERSLLVLLAACLVFPALAEAARPWLLPSPGDAVAAFEYEQLAASNDRAFGHGSFVDAAVETARVFAWSVGSPPGRFGYLSFAVQMATGTIAGFVLGRRGWPKPGAFDAATLRRVRRAALAVAIAIPLLAAIGAATLGLDAKHGASRVAAVLATTIGRFALAAFYALVVVELAADAPRWLRPLQQAGRMPLSNYLLQTLLASFVFYGWGLGRWGRADATAETVLAVVLFFAVQLPLSSLWLARWRQGPLEAVWRRFAYG